MINSFPDYEFVKGSDGKMHNMFRGIDLGFGGLVIAKPGMYGRTKTFDVSGMHPASIRALNAFGEYTSRFGELVDLRLAIKHKDFDTARNMLDGKVAKYLDDENSAKALAAALKIAVNSCYGLTSASFENPMRDPRNVNNIVALRGALFMATLKEEVEKKGYEVIHIKTDSIKVVNPDEAIANYICDFGHQYGYNFEIEHSFEKICLVNDAVYIAKCAEDDPEIPGQWTATGTQFAIPYVFKTLFSKEKVEFDDLCETKSVSTSLYLDMNENLPDVTVQEKELENYIKQKELPYDYEEWVESKRDEISIGHNYIFIGKVGSFVPIKSGRGGGLLMRESNDCLGYPKYVSATGTKGYRWKEAEVVRSLGLQDDIDMRYYQTLVDNAVSTISQYGDFEWFTSDKESIYEDEEQPFL